MSITTHGFGGFGSITTVGFGGYTTVVVYPIVIDNFSIGIEEWVLESDLNYFAVDVTDSTYGISTAGTYFIHDGQVVSTTYSGISDGYRCYYTPSDIYSDGVIDLTMHAGNTVSGVKEQTFHLLYGYNVLFEDPIDWGLNTKVPIRAQVSNSAHCPNTVAEGFYFITESFTSSMAASDLGASIQAVGFVELNAKIYPRQVAFFYGETYEITVSGVRDFSGNIMDPYIYSFTIQDPNN